MATNFQVLRDRMAPERQDRVRAETQRMLDELAAAPVPTGSDGVAPLPPDAASDITVAALRRLVTSLGGTPEITARFDDGRPERVLSGNTGTTG